MSEDQERGKDDETIPEGMRTLHISQDVLVKITPFGEKIWKDYYRNLNQELGDLVEKRTTELELKRDDEGYTEMQLSKVFKIFGSNLSAGKGNPPAIEAELLIKKKE